MARNFLILVGIAAIPAFIAVWYFMKQWLATFAYHTDMNYLLFGAAFIIVLLITLLTTGFHALKAARGNPITSLRYE
ncbi:MAG: ABC transporter permease [Saprospiraceae bacterium]